MAKEMNFFDADEQKMIMPTAPLELQENDKAVHKANKFLQFGIGMIALLLITAAALLVLYLQKEKKARPVHSASEPTKVQQMISPTPSPTPVPTPTPVPIPREEWYLRLVNAQNPLPEPFEVETVSISPAGYYIDQRAADDFFELWAAGEEAGVQLKIASAYRSFDRQKTLFEAKVKEYLGSMDRAAAEEEAAKQVARPGQSEHNTGLALDIVATYNQRMQSDYAETPESKWLFENAWKYGFILRYPQDKEAVTGVTYEPWHYRYVGKEQAAIIYKSGLCLEEYLV